MCVLKTTSQLMSAVPLINLVVCCILHQKPALTPKTTSILSYSSYSQQGGGGENINAGCSERAVCRARAETIKYVSCPIDWDARLEMQVL